MKRSLVAILVAASLHASAARSQTLLYGTTTDGAEGPSSLYLIDPATGAGTLFGSIGFNRCSALEASDTGSLYAVCDRDDGGTVLVGIDRATGVGTEIGVLGVQGQVTDISFDSAGTLYGYVRSKGDFLVTIDLTDGSATLVGSTGTEGSGNAMSFSAGTLYHADGDELNTLDETSGTGTPACTLVYPDIGGGGERVNAMDAHPVSQVLYGSVLNPEPDLGAPDAYLATVDSATCAITLIGSTESLQGTLDGLAWLVVPDLAITKTDAPDPVAPGAQLTYTIMVENLGLADAPNVVVTDTLPAGTTLVSSTGCLESPAGGAPTCTIASVPGSGSAVVTLVVSVSPAAIGPLVNVATIAPSQANQDPANDSATTSTAVTALGPPIPTLSEWALGAMALVLLATGLLFVRRL